MTPLFSWTVALRTFNELMQIFLDFERASGLKVNYDKSLIFPLGNLRSNNQCFPNMYCIQWTLGPVTLFGITFDHDKIIYFS